MVIGGSGHVGRLILPLMSNEFDITVYDLVKPPKGSWKFVHGDVLNFLSLCKACQNQAAIVYLAMGKPDDDIHAAYDVNVKGLHLALEAAWKAKVPRAVYASTLSIYEDLPRFDEGGADDEAMAPRPSRVYGLSKFFGEEVCRFVSRKRGMTIFALRLFLPVSQEERREKSIARPVDCRTSAPDVARAFIAALNTRYQGFEVFHITGDRTGKAFSHSKAKKILNWSL